MMKSIKTKITCILLALFSLLTLASCGGKGNGGDSTEPPATENPTGEALVIVDNGGASEYVILTPEGAAPEVTDAARTLQNTIHEKTGVLLEWRDDFVARGSEIPQNAKEILLGNTNRTLSATAAQNSPKSLDYAIVQQGEQVAITAGKDITLQAAVASFAERYITDKSVKVPTSEKHVFTGTYAVDSLLLAGSSIQEYQILADNADSQDAAKALQELIDKQVGYFLEIVTRSGKNQKYIRFCKSNDTLAGVFTSAIGNFEAGWSCAEGELIFGSGAIVTAEPAVALFGTHYLSGTEKTVALSNGTQKLQSMETDTFKEADDAYLEELNAKAEAMKNQVLSAVPNFTGFTGTKYYVSNNGSDSNDGTTPNSAWKTLSKVNSHSFRKGDVILLERGGEWRGKITVSTDGIMVSNYGDGSQPLPIINGSKQNYADADLWEATSTPNVWRCKVSLYDVGVIVFDHSGQLGDYTAKRGRILFHKASDEAFYNARGGAPLGVSDLNVDLQFYSDLSSSTLYLYSANGNPGARFESIEIGTDDILLNVGGWDGKTVDGIHFRFSGGFAVNGGVSNHVVVRNCVMEWIGGSVLNEDMLYGNAIQIYGQVQDFTVENNWIYQIYDTGITFQISSRSGENCHYDQINIRNNLVEYCHWAIEFYNQENESRRSTKNVLIENNFCRYGGMGWGSEFRHLDYDAGTAREASAALLCSWGLTPETENFVVKNNIFDRCTGQLGLVMLPDTKGDHQIELSGNTYVQVLGQSYGKIFKTFYSMGSGSADVMTNTLLDKTGTLAFVVPNSTN